MDFNSSKDTALEELFIGSKFYIKLNKNELSLIVLYSLFTSYDPLVIIKSTLSSNSSMGI